MMGCNVFILLKLLLISEFHSHCSCLSHQYHFVNINLSWTDAQTYCRENYTDLATIDNMEEMKRLTESVDTDYTGEAWIGLKKGTSWRWQWSSGEGGTGYTNWATGATYNQNNGYNCVGMKDDGYWNNVDCFQQTQTGYFICYTGSRRRSAPVRHDQWRQRRRRSGGYGHSTHARRERELINSAPTYKDGINATWNFTLINQQIKWFAAQNYCRHSYTDLATVRKKEDNDLIHKMFNTSWAWIGLFRDTWEWSDLSNSSFRNWKMGQNDSVGTACALAQVTWPGTWDMTPCDEKHPFICYDDNLILVNRSMTWNEALNYCRTHHSDLASVHNEEIQYWVSRRAEKASTDHVWLGLRFSCYLNFWFWVSAENVCYQNWAPNNISNSNLCGTTGAVQSKDPHYWVSLPETKELNFICTKCPSKADPRTQYLQNCHKCV
nr:macrophage mannose receptor 1-like isoform X2 [Paramormyrops kingsleyae]